MDFTNTTEDVNILFSSLQSATFYSVEVKAFYRGNETLESLPSSTLVMTAPLPPDVTVRAESVS